jgi:alkylation response protein AidB-like acyl-CoA dehydrogenase
VIDFALSDEHRSLQALAHRFAAEEIRPVAAQLDEEESFPWDLVRRAAEVGIPAYAIPEAYGGAGFTDVLARCVVDEELYWGCAGVATALGGSLLAATPIMVAGDEDQKTRFLPRFSDTQSPALGAFALTEPGAGSDPGALTTHARRVGDAYELTGTKCFITNGGIADLYVVFATMDRSNGTDGITAFVVEGQTDGLVGGKKERKMGVRASHTATIHLENVRVPVENRLGREGDGFAVAMKTFDHTRAHIAAGAVGIARAAYELATTYSEERQQFGRPIGRFQGVGFLLADMATTIDAARLLAWRSAWLADQGRPCTKAMAMAKAFAGDTAMRVTTDAVQVLGGYGYTRDYPAEKWMRDAKIMQIYEGTAQIQRVIISRRLKEAA